MNLKEHKNGIIGTIIFHTILLFIFLFMGFIAPEPTFPEPEGILINFGTDDFGSGEIEPENNVAEPIPVVTNPVNNVQENITQDFQESAIINQKEEKVEETIEEPEEEIIETEPVEIVNNNALFPGNKNNNSTSEGETQGEGNQGDLDGTPDSNNYTGGGKGNNEIGYSLGGRVPEGKFPVPAYPSGNISGKVVVNIKVDKYGKVISVEKGKGCTTTDQRLINAAIKAAWKAKFNKDFNSIAQTGTITYNFTLQ